MWNRLRASMEGLCRHGTQAISLSALLQLLHSYHMFLAGAKTFCAPSRQSGSPLNINFENLHDLQLLGQTIQTEKYRVSSSKRPDCILRGSGLATLHDEDREEPLHARGPSIRGDGTGAKSAAHGEKSATALQALRERSRLARLADARKRTAVFWKETAMMRVRDFMLAPISLLCSI